MGCQHAPTSSNKSCTFFLCTNEFNEIRASSGPIFVPVVSYPSAHFMHQKKDDGSEVRTLDLSSLYRCINPMTYGVLPRMMIFYLLYKISSQNTYLVLFSFLQHTPTTFKFVFFVSYRQRVRCGRRLVVLTRWRVSY